MKKHLSFFISLFCVVLFFIAVCIFPIQSEDLWMYLNLGEFWNSKFTLPATDPFVFWSSDLSFYGFHQWLAYLTFFYTDQVFGLTGIVILKTVLIGLSFTLPWIIRKKNPGSLWILSLPLAFYASGFKWVERTSLFSDLLTVASIFIVSSKIKYTPKGIALFSAIALLWVNFHPSFPILIILLGIGLFADFFQERLSASEKKYRRLLLLTPLLFLLNPLGLQGALYPFHFMMNEGKQMSLYFTEWYPTFSSLFLNSSHTYCLIALGLTALTSLAVFDRKNIFSWLLLVLFTVELFQAIRFATTFAFISCYVIYQSTYKIETSPKIQWLRYGILTGVLILSCNFIYQGTDTISGHRQWGFGVDVKVFPKTAAEFALKKSTGNFFNTHIFGCGLTYLWKNQRKVFFHGFMTDMDFYKNEYLGFYRGLPEFRQKVKKYQIEGFIVDRFQGIQSLVDNIQADGIWEMSYVDEGSAVFTKK